MSAIAVIPARYASTRFPGKPLQPLNGKPVIQHVYERVSEARLVQGVFVATDHREIYEKVIEFGGRAVMTDERHQSGTDRVAEAVAKIRDLGYAPEVIVNVQGDEPMIRPSMVDDLIELMKDGRADMGTLAKKLEARAEIIDPNVVKVVFNAEGFALYFSRSPIPYHRDRGGVPQDGEERFFYKHIGIYAFREKVLMGYSRLPASELEELEKLEQLRALEAGLRIKVHMTEFDTLGVDTPGDLKRVEEWLSLSS
ncbi:MAG: 3-deoxy-manno-octulosonate cytidylyltransferase [Nitrospirales bacterium]|nr:3-deoxy-manno-octulosonate cytidylyltransferase [Nitrospirales bacterium]